MMITSTQLHKGKKQIVSSSNNRTQWREINVCVAEGCVFFLNFFCCLSLKKQIADEAANQPTSQPASNHCALDPEA